MLNIGRLTHMQRTEYNDSDGGSSWVESIDFLGGYTNQLYALLSQMPDFGAGTIAARLEGIQRILEQRNQLYMRSGDPEPSPVAKINLIREDLAGLNQHEATVHAAKVQAGLIMMKLLAAGFYTHQPQYERPLDLLKTSGKKRIGGLNNYQGETSVAKILYKGLQTRRTIVEKRTAMINEIIATSRQKLQEHTATFGRTEQITNGEVLFHRAKLLLLAYPVDRLGQQAQQVKRIINAMHCIPRGPNEVSPVLFTERGDRNWHVYSPESFRNLQPALLELEKALEAHQQPS